MDAEDAKKAQPNAATPANRPSSSITAAIGKPSSINRTLTKKPATPTVVEKVSGLPDRVPENALRFYLHFSRPMTRGEGLKHVHLANKDGDPVEDAFLDLAEELWSADGKRLTLTAARPFPRGTYRVTWHAAGTDTHRMQGNYSFTVR